ncbi:MAG: TetR/AcrR family transcriptional regulator [Alphaproteobacteria bacterium]|jgi:TetR/AcrR family transcriptional repressor of nem operon|uniref:TetR/AcrR family transcriptional regulator n=1 Tax=Pacificispira sp. TaxID=2888761 RepID=UPI0032FEF451
MGRPTKFDRDEAVETAMETIWTNGFEKSSVKNLAETLGMTRSSFYNAFGTREDLFLETVPLYAKQSPDAILNEAQSGPVLPAVVEMFRAICRTRAADPEARGCMIINTICEICPDTDGLGRDLQNMIEASTTRFEDLMTHARENGELPPDADPHAIALALQNLMIGLNVYSKVQRSEDELWLSARTTLNGLGIPAE